MATNKPCIEIPNRFKSLNNSEDPAIAHIVAGADDIYDDDKAKKQSVVNQETDTALANRYTKDETYSKNELNNLITTPNQQYVSVTATDQTTAVTDVLPAEGSADTVYRVGNWDGTQYDDTVYSEYAWNGTSYVHLSTKTLIGEVFDISAYHATGGTLATYADLAAAIGTNGANVPEALRKGGMSIKFVSSIDHKYVQFRLKTNYFSIYEFNWEQCGVVEVTNQNESDLDFSDDNGNVLARFNDGEVKTKNFDSRDIKIKDINLGDIDYAVSDENNKLLVEFSNGEVKTKNFDSRNLKTKNTNNDEIDYAVSDEQSNLIVEFSDGHVKTKNFDSRHITHFGTFSIIGDSYSAFRGYSGPNGNVMWYPNPSSGNNVTEIEQMWFYKFANEYKSALVQNDSYAGSTICYDGYEEGHDAGYADISFCKRIERFTSVCELLLIFGGTNDSWAGSSIGEYKYSDWTEDDKSYFRPALAYLIDYIKKHHIGTQIVFILNTGLSSDINTSIETICGHYSVPLLKLSNIGKTEGHPNASGMTSISEQLTYFLNHF